MNKRILYYSTNRDLNESKIVDFKQIVTFKEALFIGMAPDKGLFMPSQIPQLSKKDILSLKGKQYHEVAYEILKRFLSDEIKDKELKNITKKIYDFEIPIDNLDNYTYIIRLDQGPSASFKDFAARLMANLMHKFKQKNKSVTVLVATSGDTGSAIGKAYKGLDGIKVFILYPKSEVSLIQKKQLDTIGQNVQSIAIDGKFDDCQRLVKEAFSDSELANLNLASANSINIGRVLPQIPYYFYAYVSIADNFKPVIFSIPSGNFGNALGCEIARRMGLPIEKIIIATNQNDEFPKFLKSGIYEKVEPSRTCLSNSMNIGNPSNLARFFDLYGGNLDKEGITHKKPNLKEMKKYLYSVAISDEETIETIKQVYNNHKIIVEPHGAVGIAALLKYFKENKKAFSICLETAHPAKFPGIIRKVLNIYPKKPNSLININKRRGEPDYLPNNYAKFKEYLLNRHKK
ncbi:threonine synthase [Candidatus Woesearchaeota archaeon]|nr:threonine synthase [Candidatus Woesearchaeota archaeon]